MTVAAAISAVLNYTDNVPATDAGNAGRRLRILRWLQETLEFVWNFRAWRFTYTTSSSISVDSSGVAILPTDFGQFGNKGGLFIPATGETLSESMNAKDLYSRFLAGVRNQQEFAMLGFDTTTHAPKIQTLMVSTTIAALYCKQAPTLADSTTLPADDSLDLPIPQDYHNSVLIAGAASKSKVSKGDVRDFKSDFLVGLDMMCRKEQPMQGDAQELPLSRTGW